MATDFKMVHEFNCTPERLWELIESEAIDMEMAAASGADTRWLESHRGEEITMRKQVTLDVDLPKAMTKVMGSDQISYVLETERAADDNIQEWTIKPNVLGDRFKCHGTTAIEPTSTGCRRIINGRVSISVPLLGKKMEQRLVETTKDSYDKGADVLRGHVSNG